MDPISGLFTLLILIAFAYGMYVAYQKFVVEGGLFETPEPVITQPTTPAPTPSVWEVSGVNSERGRPSSDAVYSGKKIKYYGGGEKLLANGRAKAASVCYDYSKSLGINNWGWDRKNKSCFAYIDSNILSAMSDATKVEGKSDYAVGCTEPGLSPKQGCMDFTGGDVVKGNKSTSHTTIGTDISLEQCRKAAQDNGFDAFLYTTNRYQSATDHTTKCWSLNNPEDLRGYTGDVTDISHLNGCTDKSKKIANACE